jgi:hypothetical protein
VRGRARKSGARNGIGVTVGRSRGAGSRFAGGSRRLSSQTLVDLRLSRIISIGVTTRIELLLDVFNLFDNTAENSIASDNLFAANFGQPNVFVDPRRVMLGIRLNLGK